ncbi:peroxisomal succinyl-coenzyme A thioesterase isoform X2 [Rhinolophus sinicus]|uniref:peroxisomal succinyl-coenzyme A thioesterase isoform X2 n=1 Tax=Rhinolophus sinicus TaxID=89399 RepID=UPI003D7AF9DA
MTATVRLEPAGRCRWDEPVRIVVRGLVPRQPVTLRAYLRDEKGTLFRAHARYCADARGEVDLTRAPALGGSFVGLEPMGLLWALEPEKPFWRFLKRDVQTPFAVELAVLDGHEPEGGRLLGRTVHERHFLPPGVRREPVRAGRVRATLFLPPGEPGLLGVRERVLWATSGFWYCFRGVCLGDTVKGPGIGLLGISLGADICLSMASFLKNVSATVSINGSGFSGNKSIYYKETCIPPLGHDLRRIKINFSGLLDIVDIRNDIVGGHENLSMIPIEKAQGPILFIVGQDDHNWRSELYAQIASERLQAHGKEKPQIISYPGTGHYIEPPYFPWCPASLHKLLKQPVIWGGEPRAHSKAQVDAWKQILTFFYTHLGGNWKGASPKL